MTKSPATWYRLGPRFLNALAEQSTRPDTWANNAAHLMAFAVQATDDDTIRIYARVAFRFACIHRNRYTNTGV